MRVTKVGLDVDEKPYTRGVERATKATEGLEGALDDVAGAAKDTTAATERAKDSTDDLGGSAKDAGRDLNRLRDDARRLDEQIGDTATSIRDLARQIAAASDEAERAKLTEKLKVERVKQRQQVNLRKLIDVDSAGGMGAEIAEKVSVQFAARLGPLLTRVPMGPAGAAIGAGLVAYFGPILSAGAAAAVVGGVGAGGVIGGLKLAAQDSRVQAAGKELSDNVMGDLESSATRFVQPAIRGIKIIDGAWADVADDIDAALASASRYVEPLAEGVADFGRELAPSLARAADAAAPIFEVVREDLPKIGDALSDVLDDFSDDADEGASAVRFLFQVVEEGIRVVGGAVDGFAQMYRAVLDISDAAVTAEEALLGWNPLFKGTIADGRQKVDELKAALDKGGEAGGTAGEKIKGGLDKVETAASDATVEVESLDTALHRLVDQNISVEEANIAMEEAIDRATEAAKRNGEGIDTNKPKQRDNYNSLVDLAKATNDVYEKTLAQTGSHELAAQAAARGRKKFLETADAMGVEKGKAVELADKLIAIPNVTRTVTINANTQPAIDSAKAIVARINQLKARINVSANPSGSFGGSAHTGLGYSTGNRWGGIYQHAQVGVLREAHIAAPVAPARYAYAEPATGGEAFIPRFGNPDRSVDILSRAARWYGQQVMPAGGMAMAAGGAPEVRVFIGDQELRGMVRVEVSEHNRGLRRRVGAGAGR